MRPVRLLLALLLVPAVAPAAEADVESRLKALEERVRALEEENARLRAAQPPAPAPATPEIAPKPGTGTADPAAVTPGGGVFEAKVGGFVQAQSDFGGRPDVRFRNHHDRVYVRRARINVSGRIREDWDWKVEFEHGGGMGDVGDSSVLMSDAFARWHRFHAFEVKAGHFKTPFGFEQLWSDTGLPFVERTLGSDRLALGRQQGVQVGGARRDDRFAWAVAAFNGERVTLPRNDDERFLVVTRLSGVPATFRIGGRDGRLALGVGAYRSEDSNVALAIDFGFDGAGARSFEGKRLGLGADLQLVAGRFEWWAEWLDVNFEPLNAIPDEDFHATALMTQATWMLPNDKVQLVARWDAFDPDRERDADDTTTWTAGVQWLLRGQDLKLQANWMHADGTAPYGHEARLLLRLQIQF